LELTYEVELLLDSLVYDSHTRIDDAMKLFRDYGILARNLIELGALACAVDERFAKIYARPIVSLAKVVAFYLHRSLDKGPVRVSNWELELTKPQIICMFSLFVILKADRLSDFLDAANDAHCAIMVYSRIMEIAQSTKRKLDPSTFTSDLVRELEMPKRSSKPVSTISNAPSDSKTTNGDNSVSAVKRQHLRAYTLWYAGHGLLDICIKLRSNKNPLREITAMCVNLRAN
jgi:hypothetical protein